MCPDNCGARRSLRVCVRLTLLGKLPTSRHLRESWGPRAAVEDKPSGEVARPKSMANWTRAPAPLTRSRPRTAPAQTFAHAPIASILPSVPLFNFTLRPLEDLQPWRGPHGPSLSWFGLSDGWFWLTLGGQNILQIDGEIPKGDLPYADYQVVRLWEDLIQILPQVLTEVPSDIADRLDDQTAWSHVLERAKAQNDAQRAAQGMGWWWQRQLDNAYLVAAPSVHLWRRNDIIHAQWSTPERNQGWTRVEGHTSFALEDFLDEVRAFDQAFLTAMHERVAAVAQLGGIPGVSLDLVHLAHEQRDRATWLESALEAAVAPYQWNDARWILQQLGEH